MPSPASPAIVSPETTEMVSGRNSGVVTTRAVTETNMPFWVTLSSSGGPAPGPGGEAEKNTTRASSTGIAASAPSIAQVRPRRSSTRSSEARSAMVVPPAARSLGNVEPLPGQRHEQLFHARPAHLEAAHAHPGGHQLGDQTLGSGRVLGQRGGQVGAAVGGLLPAGDRQPEANQLRGGALRIHRTQPHLGGTGRLQLGQRALRLEPA